MPVVQSENTREQALSNCCSRRSSVSRNNQGTPEMPQANNGKRKPQKKRNLHKIPFIRKLRPFGKFVYVNSLPHGIWSSWIWQEILLESLAILISLSRSPATQQPYFISCPSFHSHFQEYQTPAQTASKKDKPRENKQMIFTNHLYISEFTNTRKSVIIIKLRNKFYFNWS